MRIRIELNLIGETISIQYKSKLQGMIYHMVKSNPSTRDMHDHGYRVENRPFKLFVFSDLIGQFKYDPINKEMHFESNAYFEVSSLDEPFMIEMIKHLQDSAYVMIGHKRVEVIDFQVIDPLVMKRKDVQEYQTISPITVYRTANGRTVYYAPDQAEFFEIIHNNIIKKHEAGKQMEPLICPEVNVVSFEKRSVYFREHFVVAYNVRFLMTQVNETYERLMMGTGLGSKNPMGFGMIRREN